MAMWPAGCAIERGVLSSELGAHVIQPLKDRVANLNLGFYGGY